MNIVALARVQHAPVRARNALSLKRKKVKIMSKALCIIVVLAAATAANAAFPTPTPPGWFVAPPGPTTRLQYHSFHADPNSNQLPDWTFDGFAPSVQDSWVMPTGVSPQDYGLPNPAPWGVYWSGGTGTGGGGVPLPGGNILNDNIGLMLNQAGTLTKQMGNLANESEIKEFYALAIWTTVPGSTATLNISVTSPETTVSTVPFGSGEGTMFATVITGTIEPQPDFEDFSFAFSGPAFIDEIYIGTYCTPEPATLSLLALGTLAVLRKRRKQ